MKEIWKTIPGFSGYEASNRGDIRSLNYKRTGRAQVLKPGKTPDGYLKTMILDDNKKYRSWTVHLFICLAFKGKKEPGMEVNHIDGDKTNNNVNNLEYLTHSENVQHSFDTGLQAPKRGTKNGMSKLVEKQVKEIREYAEANKPYYNRKMLAEKYGVSQYCIKDIVTKKRNSWPHV